MAAATIGTVLTLISSDCDFNDTAAEGIIVEDVYNHP